MVKTKRVIALLIILAVVISSFNWFTIPGLAVADEESNVNEQKELSIFTDAQFSTAKVEKSAQICKNTSEEFTVPDIITEDEAKKYTGRLKDEEKDLYTFIFTNRDDSNTIRIFSHPVKYVDKDGITKDISLKLQKSKNGVLKSTQHVINAAFSPDIKEGISLTYQDINIIMRSDERFDEAKLSDDSKKVIYRADDKTSYVYSLTYAGIKEDIEVNEYTGQTKYEFVLKTNGLHPVREEESFFLADRKGTIKASIGDIIIYSADEKNNTIGRLEYEPVEEDEEYRFVITLDEEYLKDERTAYPIRIDPTIEIYYNHDGAGAIEDVTINSSTTHSGTAANLYVGRHSNGSLSRTLMRFPTLSLEGKYSSQITAASVEITDIGLQYSQPITVECYIYKKTAPAWSESGTTTWSGVGTGYTAYLQDSQVVSNGQGNAGSNRYSFNIYNAARQWAQELQSQSYGLVFKASDTFENQTGTSVKYWVKKFASYNNTSNQPSLSITYRDPLARNQHYSEYAPNKYNITGNQPALLSNTYELQYRQNCYGYALGFIRDGAVTVNFYVGSDNIIYTYGYFQKPGEFAKVSDKPNLYDYDSPYIIDEDDFMYCVCYNLKKDATRLGMSVCREYPVDENSSEVPQVGCPGSSTRLIAIVTGFDLDEDENLIRDFHFYIQHDDGTWSHKPGSSPIQNTALESTDVLDNTNIKSLANEGIYSGGALKFYEISKTAVMDFPHGDKCCGNIPCNCIHAEPLYLLDRAGDYLPNSKLLSQTGSISAKFDYPKDHDVYCFTPPQTGYYTIEINPSSSTDMIRYEMRDNCGYFMQSGTHSETTSITVRLVRKVKYYFDINNSNGNIITYAFSIS